ncbi:hypothetical protein [Serratia surfactantfaciens]|uniref:Uncharacterized protein n=1 Tax=Serratia surfactantfaciens TaxID=2741499 RepID=A0ABS0LWJ4_9GAMM|nr:hypothetical protein [Serratia surfactantfaciens]MBH1919707.1 hypothetical protein [Serratia surfactantfaciens]
MKKGKIWSVVLGAVVLVPVIVILSVPSEKAEKVSMVSVCSNLTKDRMKSPSSYILGESVVLVKEASASDIAAKFGDESKARLRRFIEGGQLQYKLAEVYIDYEAKNSFGTLLKNSAACYYDIISSDSGNSYTMARADIGGHSFSGADLGIMVGVDDGRIGRGGFMQKYEYLKTVLSGMMRTG